MQKADVFTSTMKAAVDHNEADRKVEYCFNPMEVRATEKFAAGTLKLFPITDLSRISKQSTSQIIVHSKSGMKFYIDAPRRPNSADATELGKEQR